MRQQSVPAAGDVIRLDGVTKAHQAGAPPALADVSMDVAAGSSRTGTPTRRGCPVASGSGWRSPGRW
jgi:hypothetical protein